MSFGKSRNSRRSFLIFLCHMFIDRDIAKYSIFSGEDILTTLKKIDANKNRVIFTVDERGVMEGVMTDGDFRRWLMKHPNIDLSKEPASSVANKKFISVLEDDIPAKIRAIFSDIIQIIPLLDKRGHLVAIAKEEIGDVHISSFVISETSPVFIIAEIGINHNGQLDLAKQLVDRAIEAGADCAKFQMRDMNELYRNRGKTDDASEDLGSQYTLDVLSRSQLTPDEMFEIFDYCKEKGIIPLCSPWDIPTVDRLEKYGIEAYKVASADLTNHDLLRALAKTGKSIFLSTGMSTEEEIQESAGLLRNLGASFVLLQCNSTYPAPFKDIHLRYLDRLRQIGRCAVGYSGHERGIQIPVAAVARGAKVIEKHFTLDKNMEGNDHKISLLPDEFKAMVDAIRQVEQALGTNAARVPSQGELMNRENLSKSLIINCDLKEGETILESVIEVKSPGKGLQPNRKEDLIGTKAKHDFKAGDFFFRADLSTENVQRRDYHFRRPWGLPVRYHDHKQLMEGTNPDFLEFHLSYKDMDADYNKYITETFDMNLTVHSPDLFTGDHILNLAAEDDEYLTRSISELQRVIDLTRAIKPHFRKTEKTLIIASVGGFTKDAFIDIKRRDAWYDRVADSLSQLDEEGVEITPQTLPPFPWYFGGQLHLNLFVTPDDIVDFCKKYNRRVCFDISHSKLACNHYNLSFQEFAEKVGPHSAHLHIVDAQGIDGEGVQIGTGDIDFAALAKTLDKVCPEASFIPEIWQGHKNSGEGFWIALESLEQWF